MATKLHAINANNIINKKCLWHIIECSTIKTH